MDAESEKRCSFSPKGYLPIPTITATEYNNKEEEEEDITSFQFDENNVCYPSHFVLYISNETQNELDVSTTTATTKSTKSTSSINKEKICDDGNNFNFFCIDPYATESEISFKLLRQKRELEDEQTTKRPTPINSITLKVVSQGLIPQTIEVLNGDTVVASISSTDDGEKYLQLSRSSLDCPFPIHDIPVRVVNRSGEDADIHFKGQYGNLRTGVKADDKQRIKWLSWRPLSIEWSTPSVPSYNVQFRLGMTVTIRTPKAIETSSLLHESKHNQNAEEFVQLLEDAGELQRCAPIFAANFVEYNQIPLLSDDDWDRLGIKVGSKIRIKERLPYYGSSSPSSLAASNNKGIVGSATIHSTTADCRGRHNQYDLFLSHRHTGGEDLAQAIKLQLQVMFPERNLKIFLDVDNLRDLTLLQQHVENSQHFLLLLTPGTLDRPFIQSEVQTALQCHKNIILVHDIKNCPFPDQSTLPTEIRPALERISIPYYRDQSFREIAIRKIANSMGLLFDD